MNTAVSYAELLAPHVGGAALDRLTQYAELLERWAKRHNLVRFSSREELVGRHILDALAANTGVLEGRALYDRISRPVILNARQSPTEKIANWRAKVEGLVSGLLISSGGMRSVLSSVVMR